LLVGRMPAVRKKLDELGLKPVGNTWLLVGRSLLWIKFRRRLVDHPPNETIAACEATNNLNQAA
jgi:hypothetical protein